MIYNIDVEIKEMVYSIKIKSRYILLGINTLHENKLTRNIQSQEK